MKARKRLYTEVLTDHLQKASPDGVGVGTTPGRKDYGLKQRRVS